MIQRSKEEDLEDLRRGTELFSAGHYWQAHEAWEAVWMRWRHRPENLFFKGLMQLAAAHHQRVNGRSAGFLIHLNRAEAKGRFGACFMEIYLEVILASIRASRV
jgi:uncharacterized protein